MTHQELDVQAVLRLCNGNREALDWVQLGRLYCHEIDDLIDETIPSGNRAEGAERACRIGAMALGLYTHPFFLKHSEALRAAMMVNTINYRDSVLWESSPHQWQREFCDWARHGWLDVVLVVAEICGGYDLAAGESKELRSVAYSNHHDRKGQLT